MAALANRTIAGSCAVAVATALLITACSPEPPTPPNPGSPSPEFVDVTPTHFDLSPRPTNPSVKPIDVLEKVLSQAIQPDTLVAGYAVSAEAIVIVKDDPAINYNLFLTERQPRPPIRLAASPPWMLGKDFPLKTSLERFGLPSRGVLARLK